MRILDWIFLIVLVLILVLISTLHGLLSLTISFINNYGGFFSFVSVLLAIFAFFTNLYLQKEKDKTAQRKILRNLKFEIERIKEDVRGFVEDEFRKGGLPFFPIKQIDVQYYVSAINDSFERVSEERMKEKISLVNDKITLLNNYLTYILNDFNLYLSKKKIKDIATEFAYAKTAQKYVANSVIYNFWRPNILKVKTDIDKPINALLDYLKRY